MRTCVYHRVLYHKNQFVTLRNFLISKEDDLKVNQTSLTSDCVYKFEPLGLMCIFGFRNQRNSVFEASKMDFFKFYTYIYHS